MNTIPLRFLASTTLVVLAATLLLPARAAASGSGSRPPNVILIVADDLGYAHLGRYGQQKILTPNIDKLAARGVTFRHAYAAAPVCNPSRAALLSGMRPSTTGVYGNDDDWRTVIKPELTLISTFRKAGYYTAGAGKIYHESFARKS